MNEYQKFTLDQVSVNIYSGGTPTTTNPDFWNGNFPWLSSGETRNRYITKTEKSITEQGIKNSSTRLAKKNDIIIASAGQGFTRGQTSFSNIDTYVNQSLIVIRANEEIANPKYLFFNLSNRYEELRKLSDAHSSRGSLTTKLLKGLEICLPNLQTQNKIAEILTSLDDKIELNNRMNQTLGNIAQAIFKQWFVDFRFPGFDGELVDGLPKGWSMGKVGEIVEVTDFVANGSFASLKENVNLLEQNDLSVFALYVRTTDNNNNFNGNLKYVDKSSYEFLKKSTLYGNEVIISNVGDVGTVFRPPVWLQKPMTLGSNAIMIKENILCNYLYEFFSSYQGQYLLSGIVSGSAQPKFNKTSFRNLEILVPNEQIIVEFNNFYNRILDKIINNRSEIETLTELRNSLLPKLMSGKINVN